MAEEELTLILRLRDEATKQMKSARAGIIAAGAAIAAAGFTAGKKWDEATKTIVAGTGATGQALKGLQADYQAVAKYGDGAATAIADLNTHLGLEGEELQRVAEAALKAKVDTNLFGDVAAQMGLDAQGTAELLDQLTVASQGSGVSIDKMTQGIGRNAARWVNAGGDMGDLTALVVEMSDKFGPSGLRGAMSEIFEEVDKGLIPTIASLESQLGDTTGAVERTYEASKTWRDTLRETKDAALAYIGPAGDMLGALGSTASGLALAGPQMLKWIKATKFATLAQKAFNLAMRLNPIGLIVSALVLVGLAIYKWRDQIWGFLKGAWNGFITGLESGYNRLAQFVPGLKEVSFAAKMSFEPAVERATLSIGDLARESQVARDGLEGKPESLVTGLVAAEEATVNFLDTVKEIPTYVGQAVSEIGRMGAVGGAFTGSAGDFGLNYSRAFAAGFVSSDPGGVMTVLPNGVVSAVSDPAIRQTLEEAGHKGAGKFSKAWSSSGGWKGMMSGASAAVGAFATGGWKAGVMSMAQTAMNFLPPGMAQAAQAALAAVSAVWKKFKRPSEAELAAREMFTGFRNIAVKELGGTERFADEVQVAIAAGWDRTLAETRAAFIVTATAAGVSYDDAFGHYERYQKAVGEGNTELMACLEAQYVEWQGMAAETAANNTEAFKESTDEIVLDAGAIGDQFRNLTAKEALDLEQALAVLGPTAAEAFTHIHNGAINSANALGNEFLPRIRETIAELNRIPRNITTTITTLTVPGRQHGGPVSAGRPYMVGEAGPEMFVPGQSGGIVPNEGIPSAEEIGAAVAAAMQRAPLVVPQDPVTDALYRNGPRRAALHGYA